MATNSNGVPVTVVTDGSTGAVAYATVYLINPSVAASGTNSTTAAVLPSNSFVSVTGATGANGVRLPSSTTAGSLVIVDNSAASDLLVYPSTGGQISGGGTDVAATMTAHTQAQFLCTDGTNWSALIPTQGPAQYTNVLRADPAFLVPLAGGYGNATRNWYDAAYQMYNCTPSGASRGFVLPGGADTGTLIYFYNGGTDAVTAYADAGTSDVVWSGDGSTTSASGTVPATGIAVYIKSDATHWTYTIYVGSNVGGGGTTDSTARSTANSAYSLAQTGTNAAATAQSTATSAYSIAVAGTNAAAAALTPLTSAKTYYVATTGNDSSNGTTVGTPFLTIQKACDEASSTFVGTGGSVTIQVANGTYTAPVAFRAHAVEGGITILGNTGTPSSVLVSVSTGANVFYASNVGRWILNGMKLSSSNNANAIRASYHGQVFFQNIDFGGVGSGRHLLATRNGIALALGAYSISGGAGSHYYAEDFGLVSLAVAVTLTGTPAFTTFAIAGRSAIIVAQGSSFTGSATGTRYSAYLNGVIETNGGGANFLPGNVAGSTSTGGQYN